MRTLTVKQTFLLLLLVFPALLNKSLGQQPASNKAIAGSWSGAIRAGGLELDIIFHISEEAGKLSATMDVPAQGAKGIPVSSVRLLQDSLFLEVQAVGGDYVGSLTNGKSINGLWHQAGQSMPLQLQRGIPQPLLRPQEPPKPYPYQEQEVRVENKEAGIQLAGTLTIPQGKEPYPAVVLFAGSGPQDRNASVMGHKPFLVLADHLTRQGFAVLRLDDRGVGASEGRFIGATTKDFISDAKAAFAYLSTHKSVIAGKVGLIGHSEGALVAAAVAAQRPEVAFVVLMAGSAVPGTELLLAQNHELLRAEGLEPGLLQKYLRLRQEQFAVAVTVEEQAEAARQIRKLEQEVKATLTAQEQARLGLSPQSEQAVVTQLSSPWMRYFLAYDPAPSLEALKMPVLAMFGSKDVQVPPTQNLPATAKSLKAGKNKRYTIKELPNLNHLFQNATTGSPAEYSQIEETLAPAALELISSWVKQVVK